MKGLHLTRFLTRQMSDFPFSLISFRKQFAGLTLFVANAEAASISKVESPKEIIFVIID
jgi:hypothetical protein